MWIGNWQQMYICEDTSREPEWVEYEEVNEDEQGMSEEEAVADFERKYDLPEANHDAVMFIFNKARDGEMTDEEMTVGFFICGQIEAHDDMTGADRIFWEIEELLTNK